MKKFVVATRNKGKVAEIKEILKDLPLEVVTMGEAGLDTDIEETGKTFEENALIKARFAAEKTGHMVMADDSGLEVDYLDNAPGIYSARYAGENATDEDRNRKLLANLEGVPEEKRTARFVCAIAVVFPDGREFCVRGICEGIINHAPKGTNGFGYDPLFYLPQYGMTMAEISADEKNKISHRAKAMMEMVERLKKYEDSWRPVKK